MEPLNRSRDSPAYDTFVDEVEQDNEEVHDYNDILNEIGCGPFQILICVSLSLSAISGYLVFLLINILPKVLNCDADWSTYIVEYFGLITCLGLVVGAVVFGIVADIYGRKISLIASNVLIAAFMIGCAFSPSTDGLVGMFFFVAVGAGGSFLQPTVYVSEILPAKFRSLGLFSIFCVGIVGLLIALGIAIPVMEKGWKVLLGLLAIFPIIAAACSLCMPESPLYNLSQQESAKGAIGTLQLAVRLNHGSLPTGRLLSKESENRGNPMGAFDSKVKRPTILFLIVFIIQGIVSDGITMTNFALVSSEGNCGGNETVKDEHECTVFNKPVIVAAIAETAPLLFAIVVGLILVETIGRKFSVAALSCVVGALSLINIACLNMTTIKVLTTISQFSAEAIFVVLSLFVVEVYDNEIRAVMLAICFAIYMLAHIIGAIIYTYLFVQSIMASLIFLGILGVVGGALMFAFPEDTKGKSIE